MGGIQTSRGDPESVESGERGPRPQVSRPQAHAGATARREAVRTHDAGRAVDELMPWRYAQAQSQRPLWPRDRSGSPDGNLQSPHTAIYSEETGMNLKLYSRYRNSAGQRVRTSLNIKGLEYEYIPVSLAGGAPDSYREEINPQALIPSLVDRRRDRNPVNRPDRIHRREFRGTLAVASRPDRAGAVPRFQPGHRLRDPPGHRP